MVYDVFDTADGSDLDSDCIRYYTDIAEQKTASMLIDIENAVETFCGEDIAAVITYAQIFAGLGQQVYSKSYIMMSSFICD